jgi:hypothetical protein
MAATHSSAGWRTGRTGIDGAETGRSEKPASHVPCETSSKALPAVLALAAGFFLLAITVLDRFGVRVSQAFSLSPSMIALYGLVAAMLWTGALRIAPTMAALCAAALTCVGVSLFININYAPWWGVVSISSWSLLVALYLPFMTQMDAQRNTRAMQAWLMQAFLFTITVVAACGVVQYMAQFVLRAPWLIDFTPMIPEPLRASGLANTANVIGRAFKSNGFFMREASGFSFMVALAMVLEWNLRRRIWMLAILAAGQVVSYSGSGLAVLLVAMLVPLGFKTVLRVGVAALVLVVLYMTAGEALQLDYTLGRVGEFGSDRSSAYCRFVLPAQVVWSRFDVEPWVSLLGHGPGTMQKITGACETTYGKLLFEYGLLGGLAFTALVVAAVRRSWMPAQAKAGLLVYWYLLGGNLLRPEALVLIFALCAMWPEGSMEKDRGRALHG